MEYCQKSGGSIGSGSGRGKNSGREKRCRRGEKTVGKKGRQKKAQALILFHLLLPLPLFYCRFLINTISPPLVAAGANKKWFFINPNLQRTFLQ